MQIKKIFKFSQFNFKFFEEKSKFDVKLCNTFLVPELQVRGSSIEIEIMKFKINEKIDQFFFLLC